MSVASGWKGNAAAELGDETSPQPRLCFSTLKHSPAPGATTCSPAQRSKRSGSGFGLRCCLPLGLCLGAIVSFAPALAQTAPRDLARPGSDFLQPAPTPAPVSPTESVPVTPPSPTPAAPASSPVEIPVRQIEVIGSTVFTPAELAAVTSPYEGRSLTLEQLRQIADAITQLYLNRGYITSRAVLVDQQITDGRVQFRVIEGSLEAIEIEGARRVRPAYIRSRVRLGGKTPLNQSDLEDQLRLLRLDPLFTNVEASLRAGSGLGQSILTVRVTEANPWIASLSIDNFSPPSVGSERLGAVLGYRNLTGNGDMLLGSIYHSTTSGSDLFDLSYQIPVNAMNGTLQLRAAPERFRITDPQFADLDIHGSSDLYEVSFRQPLVRSPREEFALSLGFTYRDGRTLVGGTTTDSSTTSVIRFGQDYVHRDPQGAWALRSQFNFGTGLFDATTSGSPNGLFFSWLGQVQRVQILDQSNLLILQLDGQLTPDALLPSQQFVIGGGQSLRGYRQNARLGDNGFRFSAEDRIAVQRDESGKPTLQVAPFIDLGAVWNSDRTLSSRQNFLAGIGAGLLWEPLPNFNLRVDYAVPLVDLRDRGHNAQDEGFYFSVGYQF